MPIPTTHQRPLRSVGAYTELTPPPDLQPWVASLWVYRIPFGGSASPHRVLPTAGPVVALVTQVDANGEAAEARPTLIGPVRTQYLFAPRGGTTMVAAEIRPEWCRTVLGVAPEEHVNSSRSLADVNALGTARLRDFVGPTEAGDPAVIRALVRWLRERWADHHDDGPTRLVAAAMRALRTGVCPRVGSAADRLGVSIRHLRRCVLSTTGDTPKQLQRIDRLNRLVIDLDRSRTPSWSRLAHVHGYYDQSHLIHEVQALSGRTPTALHAERRVEQVSPVP